MKSISLIASAMLLSYVSAFSQNIGLGTTDPQYKLDILGSCRISSNAYVMGYMGIGTNVPNYKMTVQDGSFALYNSTDSKYWTMSYNSSSNYWYLAEDGTNRMVVTNGGNVGIGTSSPTAKLEVVGNAEVSGTMTVNNNKGVLYNLSGSQNIKFYTRTASFTINNLQPHALSVEASIGFIGGFSTPPAVYVAGIVSNGGTEGSLYALQLQIYDITTTGCKCRLLNTSNSEISQSITWNIVCIGD